MTTSYRSLGITGVTGAVFFTVATVVLCVLSVLFTLFTVPAPAPPTLDPGNAVFGIGSFQDEGTAISASSSGSRSDALPAYPTEPGVAPVIDLYGNEVIEAVATYALDPAGSLYEEHSPQTELPRLGTPQG